MAKAYRHWKVLPHGPIEKLEANLWRVEGTLPGNVPIKRVMTIAKRTDGDLYIHNAIALEDDLMAEIESFGRMAYLVVPNKWHRLDAPVFKNRFPTLRVVAPAGSRQAIEEVLPVDLTYDAAIPDRDVTIRHLAGVKEAEGVLIVRHGDRATIVFNDAIFNTPHVPGFKGFLLRYVAQSSGGPKVSRITKLALIKDRRAFREDLNALAKTPGLSRIIVSHHEVIDRDVPGTLENIAQSLR